MRGRTGRSIGSGRGGRNNALNVGAHGMGGDMGYGIGMGGRNYGEIGYHDPTSMCTYTAGMVRAPSVGKIGGNMKKTDSMAFLESFLQEEVKMAEAKQQSGGTSPLVQCRCLVLVSDWSTQCRAVAKWGQFATSALRVLDQNEAPLHTG